MPQLVDSKLERANWPYYTQLASYGLLVGLHVYTEWARWFWYIRACTEEEREREEQKKPIKSSLAKKSPLVNHDPHFASLSLSRLPARSLSFGIYFVGREGAPL